MPLFNLPKTSQEVYDIVASHMLKQNKRSSSKKLPGSRRCAYRGDDGLKCAAGCLIPDEVYSFTFEQLPWADLVEFHNFPSEHIFLITVLQDIHDTCPVREWRNRLVSIAKIYSLNTKNIF